MWPHAPRTPWRANFPDVIAQTAYRGMINHVAYRDAKDGISNDAALTLVYESIADDSMAALTKVIGDRKPRVVPVHAEEKNGRNKIPFAYAEVLAGVLHLDTDPAIVQAGIVNHTNAQNIFQRFATPATFEGYVEPDADYLIVDDTCTAGGTLANLKGFIEVNGGNVMAISVLALNQPSRRCEMSLAYTTHKRLMMRHPTLDRVWKEDFGYGLECLTEGEAGHLLVTPSVDAIRNLLAEARRNIDLSRDEAAHGGETSAAEAIDQKAPVPSKLRPVGG